MNRSIVIVETVVEQPITDEYLHEADRVALPCFQAHNVTWRYSLLSHDRLRMICTFDAPDAGTVRNSYAKLGQGHRPIWTGELLQPEIIPVNAIELYVMEIPNPSIHTHQQCLQACTEIGMQCLRAYQSLDRTRLIYELRGSNANSLEDKQRFAATTRTWSAQRLQP
jgi:hypothetical protein